MSVTHCLHRSYLYSVCLNAFIKVLNGFSHINGLSVFKQSCKSVVKPCGLRSKHAAGKQRCNCRAHPHNSKSWSFLFKSRKLQGLLLNSVCGVLFEGAVFNHFRFTFCHICDILTYFHIKNPFQAASLSAFLCFLQVCFQPVSTKGSACLQSPCF